MLTPIIDTTYGRIRGLQEDGYQVFKGIRYAEAARFQKPVLCTSDREVYEAVNFGYTCPQPGQPEGSFYDREFWHHKEYSTEKHEDCLYLNIWKPDKAENCPVAIWIHGGAFMNGFGSKVEIDGQYWNKRGIILVSINYRVGVSGFLTCKMLDEAYGDSGNYGIHDQLAAIEWVRKHIASFGGNPEHITIMGQSAGAMSVQTLLCAPRLPIGVVGAVMQSGGGIENFMNESVTKEDMQNWNEEFLATMGINSLEKLLTADISELTLAGARFASEKRGMKLMFFPHIDDEVLPYGYEKQAKYGKMRNLVCMIGCTHNDITVEGENVEASPIYQGAIKLADARNHCGFLPTYLYVFDRKPLGGEGQGAFHSSDLWYSFHTLDRSWREKDADDYRIADEMSTRWCNFILTGNPNDAVYTGWQPFHAETDIYHIG